MTNETDERNWQTKLTNETDKEIDTAENKRPIEQQEKLRQWKRLQNSKLRSTENVNQGAEETQGAEAFFDDNKNN